LGIQSRLSPNVHEIWVRLEPTDDIPIGRYTEKDESPISATVATQLNNPGARFPTPDPIVRTVVSTGSTRPTPRSATHTKGSERTVEKNPAMIDRVPSGRNHDSAPNSPKPNTIIPWSVLAVKLGGRMFEPDQRRLY